MSNKKSFQELYENLKNADNSELNEVWEEAKAEKKKRNISMLIAIIVVDLIIFIEMIAFQNANTQGQFDLLAGEVGMQVIMATIFTDMIICIIFHFLFDQKQMKYIVVFKQNVIKKLMDNFYDNVEYFPKKQMPRKIYDEARYKEVYNRYRSDDYLEAKIDGKYDIDMAEVLTQHEETHTDSQGHTSTTTTTKFYGLFAKIVLDKSILNELRITPNLMLSFAKDRLEMDSRRI